MISRYEQCTTKGRGINEIACVFRTCDDSKTYPHVGFMVFTCFRIALGPFVICGYAVKECYSQNVVERIIFFNFLTFFF